MNFAMNLYDPKCLELARHFYPEAQPRFLDELAAAIQGLIEDLQPVEIVDNTSTADSANDARQD